MSHVIETEALTKKFHGQSAVGGVSFTVEAGEVYGFLGPNGAGKTTTIRLLMGLLRPTAGAARVFGLDAWRDAVAIHRRTGNLPGDFAFDDTLSGSALLSLIARLRGVDTDARAEALAARFEADLNRPLRQLSRGNRQKIGLIQALAHEPELVILDEPTAGLDPLMQEEFLALVSELRDRGTTVFLSSHNLTEVERCCDRVALIRKGALLTVDDVDALRRRFVHQVRIVFDEPVDGARFRDLPHVSLTRSEGSVIELEVASAGLDAVLRAATEQRIVDLVCTEASLEQAFVQMYRQSDERDGAQD